MSSSDARNVLRFAAVAALLTAGGLEASHPPPDARGIELRTDPPSPHARAAGARPVEVAGCRAVTGGPDGRGPAVCEVPPDGALRVWIDARPDEAVTVTANAGPAVPRPLPSSKGRLFQVHVRPDAPHIDIAFSSGPIGAAPRLALAPAAAPDALDALAALRRADPAEARRRAAALLDDPDPVTRARAAGLVARLLRDRGDLDAAVAAFARAIERDRAAGRVSDLYTDSFALAYTLGVQLRRFEEARAVLADLGALAAAGLDSPQHEAHARYYAALIAHEAGDLRAAQAHYRASRERAARIDDLPHLADVLSQEARVLLDLGRVAEGAALHEEAAPLTAALDPCAKATFHNNWSSFLLHAEASAPDAPLRSPAEPIALAIDLAERACPIDQVRGYVALTLAQVSLRAGDPDAARDALAVAAASLSRADKHDAAELADVAAQVALADGDLATAWRAYEDLAEIARGAVLPHYRRRAALGRAELLEAAGDTPGAAAAYEELARIIADDSRLAPLGQGRLGFLEQLGRGASRYVAFLLARPGGAALAADVARRSIAHMLASLETVERIRALTGDERRAWEARLAAYRLERARIEDEARGDWALSEQQRARAAAARRAREEAARAALEEALAAAAPGVSPRRALPSPSEGELFLVYFPTGPSAWTGFAIEPSGVTARPLPEADLEDRYLRPFRAEIERARHVRFFVPRALRAIDFHALPFDRAPLIERVPVTYGLDVRSAAEPAPLSPGASDRRPAALVVADPQGTLPEARREGELVHRDLTGRGLAASLLSATAPGRASHAAVRAALDRGDVALFHFAGHARFSGTDGWDSQIPLAEGGLLRVSDVLSLPSVPRLVVLSGCETGLADGLGLAHAFVAAGAGAAVGITRVIPDTDAGEVMRLFYTRLTLPSPAGTPAAAASALQAAVRDLRRRHSAVAWESFRVLVP